MTVRVYLGPQIFFFMTTQKLLTLHWFFCMLLLMEWRYILVWQMELHLREGGASTHSRHRGIFHFDLSTWNLAMILQNTFQAVGYCVSTYCSHNKIEHPYSVYSIWKKSRLRNTRAGSLQEEETTNLQLSQHSVTAGRKNKQRLPNTQKIGTLKGNIPIVFSVSLR